MNRRRRRPLKLHLRAAPKQKVLYRSSPKRPLKHQLTAGRKGFGYAVDRKGCGHTVDRKGCGHTVAVSFRNSSFATYGFVHGWNAPRSKNAFRDKPEIRRTKTPGRRTQKGAPGNPI
jgi:hypothetical protein